MSASSLVNSTESARVWISRSLQDNCLDIWLDIAGYNNKRFKLDLTKRRPILVEITGLKDKTTGGERSCYDPSGYVIYTL
jgi:hypothetical protein